MPMNKRYSLVVKNIVPSIILSRYHLKVLIKWIEIDAQYDTYLYNDITELRGKLKDQEGTARECRKASVLLDHQIKGREMGSK